MQCFSLSLCLPSCSVPVLCFGLSLAQETFNISQILGTFLGKATILGIVAFCKAWAEVKTSLLSDGIFSYKNAWENVLDSMGRLLKGKKSIAFQLSKMTWIFPLICDLSCFQEALLLSLGPMVLNPDL